MTEIVDYYVDCLEMTLGKATFDIAFNEMIGDKRMKREEINAVASRFVSHTAKSASRQDSLQRIMNRHKSLIDSANKREWQRGKGAA